MKGIYSITNTINGKVYIGKTINDLDTRKGQHYYSLRKGKHYNSYLQNAWNKYGEESFEFDVIYLSDNDEEIDKMEIHCISFFNSTNPELGYNLTSGGDGGRKSILSREKLSVAVRGRGSSLSFDDARKIKLAMYCVMDRKEISNMFDVNVKVLTGISRGSAFDYVNPELNNSIHNLKQKLIDERNEIILGMFDEGKTITEITHTLEYSSSIVEKCVYKYRDVVQKKKSYFCDAYEMAIQLRQEGFTLTEISNRLGIGVSTVSRYVRGENNPYKELNFKKITKEKHSLILNLYYKENKTFGEIAKILNVSDTTIGSLVNFYKYTNTEVTKEIKESLVP